MRIYLSLTVLIAVAHFILSWIAFARSEVIKPDSSTDLWLAANKVLSQPLMQRYLLDSAVDLFPLLMILNSLVWGAALAGAVLVLLKLASRRKPKT